MPRIIFMGQHKITEHDIYCPDCKSMLLLTLVGKKLIYRCARHHVTGCMGSHGAQPDGSPMGIPAHWSRSGRFAEKRTKCLTSCGKKSILLSREQPLTAGCKVRCR